MVCLYVGMKIKVIQEAEQFPAGFYEQVQELITRGSLDFDTWTSLISKTEKRYPDDIEAISSVYDSFLLEFPLCHGYWLKYAAHKARLCTADKVVEIFERAVRSATYCISLWVEYCSFGISTYENPSDICRLFKRAMSFVGKDYLCHLLWDKYIEFEFSQQQWDILAQIYVQALKFPTKKLHQYYDNFKKFVAILEEEMKQHNYRDTELGSVFYGAVITSKDEISLLINNLLDPSTGSFRSTALRKFISIGERYYRDASELEKKIHCFESNIQRPYFDAATLDNDQLENWHQYLDFVELQGDFDWAVKLYERCLIPCSGYPEFWMRYVEYMESNGGRELAKVALDRATKVFPKNMPEMHLFSAQFKELIGDKSGADTTYIWCNSESSLHFVEKVVNAANREKRLGNLAAAFSIYKTALQMAEQVQKLHRVSILYVHFARLKFLMTGQIDEARDVIIDGLHHLPKCKLLLEGLINFLMMHGGQEQIDVASNIILDAITPGSDASQALSDTDRQDISVLYMQFVNLFGTIHDIRKAWSRHIKLFPQLVRPSSSDKLHKLDNQLMVIKERSNSYPDNLSLATNEQFYPSDHSQPDNNNSCIKYKLQELSPKDPVRPEEDISEACSLTHNLEEEPTGDLVRVVAKDDAKQEHEPLSLDELSLNGHEIECGDLEPRSSSEHLNTDMALENYSNATNSPILMVTNDQEINSGDSRPAVSNQFQSEQPNPSSLGDHQNALPESDEMSDRVPLACGESEQLYPSPLGSHQIFLPEPAEMGDQMPAVRGGTEINPIATYSQSLWQYDSIHGHQSQPTSVPSAHPQPQMPQFEMQSGVDSGYIQAYNQMTEYYRQQQQYMQQHYGQEQQYMQQIQQPYQQQPNLHQVHEQHKHYVQQQQLAQMYYQQLPQMHPQQAQYYQQLMQQYYHGLQQVMQHQQPQELQTEEGQQQQTTPAQTPAWSSSYYQQGNQVTPQHGSSSTGVAHSPHPPNRSP